MKITNQTKWRTDHLREIVRRVAEQELEPHERKLLHVLFTTSYIELPKTPQFGDDDVRSAAWKIKQRYYIIFEIARKGEAPDRMAWRLAHKLLRTQVGWQNRRDWGRYRSYSPYTWAKQYPLVVKVKTKKPKPTGRALQERRYQLVLAAEERWTRKLKVAQRRLVKLRQKRKYYERALKPDGSS